MGCYQCGSAHGSKTILCPNCQNQPTLNLLSAEAKRKIPLLDNDKFPPEMLAVAATGLVILLIGYTLLFAKFGPQFGISKANKVFAACQEKVANVDNRLMDNLYANLPSLEDEFASRKSNEEICLFLRDACSREPYGDVCRVAVELMR